MPAHRLLMMHSRGGRRPPQITRQRRIHHKTHACSGICLLQHMLSTALGGEMETMFVTTPVFSMISLYNRNRVIAPRLLASSVNMLICKTCYERARVYWKVVPRSCASHERYHREVRILDVPPTQPYFHHCSPSHHHTNHSRSSSCFIV